MKIMKNKDIWPDGGVFKEKYGLFFFRFFGTNGYPMAAMKLSLSDVATHFQSSIDL